MENNSIISFLNEKKPITFKEVNLTERKPILKFSDVENLKDFNEQDTVRTQVECNIEEVYGDIMLEGHYGPVFGKISEELKFKNVVELKKMFTEYISDDTGELSIWEHVEKEYELMKGEVRMRSLILRASEKLGITIHKITMDHVGDRYGFNVYNYEAYMKTEVHEMYETLPPDEMYSIYENEKGEYLGDPLSSHYDNDIYDGYWYELKDSDGRMVSPYVKKEEILRALINYKTSQKLKIRCNHPNPLNHLEAVRNDFGIVKTIEDFDNTTKLKSDYSYFMLYTNYLMYGFDRTYYLLSDNWNEQECSLENLITLATSKGYEVEVQVGKRYRSWKINNLLSYLNGMESRSVDGSGEEYEAHDFFVYYHIKQSGEDLHTYLSRSECEKVLSEMLVEELLQLNI